MSSEWRPIETAPKDRTVIVGDAGIGNTAVAHWDEEWLLGPKTALYFERLDFSPRWWLPRDHPTNPFKTPLPEPPEQKS